MPITSPCPTSTRGLRSASWDGLTRIEFPDIAGRFAPYLGWLDQPTVMKIHFEDLIHDRAGTLDRIIDHFLARVPLQVDRSLLFESLETPSTRANPRLSARGRPANGKNISPMSTRKSSKTWPGIC
jgi:hypothetical protein